MNVGPDLERNPVPVRQTSARAAGLGEPDSSAKAVGTWVQMLGRTLKTCRLYEGQNPTVVKFRDDLAGALQNLLQSQGTFTLRFTSDDVRYEEESLYHARSRDDNLALLFYRDGVRGLTFAPGAEAREVQALVDALLLVSGPSSSHDDLVTLLWEAHLAHVEVDYVPAEGDVGTGAPGAAEEERQLVPFPTGGRPAEGPEADQAQDAASTDRQGARQEGGSRSDDWTTGNLTVEIEAGFEELDFLAPSETERFRREYRAEHEVSPGTTALAIVRAFLGAEVTTEDRIELGAFLPRLLRLAVSRGAWLEAREALRLIGECGTPGWSPDTFVQELLQPITISTIAEHADRQPPAELQDLVALALELGDGAVDLLTLVLGESRQPGNRRILAEAIAELTRDRPERLAPWLADPRWKVVRNVVHILGWIGTDAIVGLLRGVVRHPEPRVRLEIVTALGQVDPLLARPLLLKLLENADVRLFAAVLQRLSVERNTAVARLVLAYLQDPGFDARPPEEKRSIYAAIAAAGTDEILPELQAELLQSAWFARGQDAHRAAVARCVARIGTPQARMVLERGAQSRRPPVRKACEEALLEMVRHE